jgi:hypothetical protein
MDDKQNTADLLSGARAIAEFLGIREKQIRHRIEAGLIPTFKLGGTICARRSTLNAWLAEVEALAMKARTPA